MTKVLIYEERLKSSSKRVSKVLLDAGMHPELANINNQWQVYVPLSEREKAVEIVWGTEEEKA